MSTWPFGKYLECLAAREILDRTLMDFSGHMIRALAGLTWHDTSWIWRFSAQCVQCLLLTSKALLYTKCRAYTLFAPSEVHFMLSNSLQFPSAHFTTLQCTSTHFRTLLCTAAAAVGLQMGLPLLMVIRVDGQIKRVVQFLDLISKRFYYLHEGIKVDSPFQFKLKSI